ncbi:YeiH family protein [Bailinhaonella thermotolerans]|uniref:Putative sulfate exporter family transporter n=1 Tax=Bailinhaonella thermotolerans TaxID=1070861 RepID=A0A3A4AZI6_9ACTN|nr:putative sulfate exporter family transporter [Bailinhaonella thermotolerans]RJL36102.1 putative sulfate exporter family transporter [Bailinhaonella thermotolerans]
MATADLDVRTRERGDAARLVARTGPGLAVVLAATALAYGVNRLLPAVSAPVLAVALGALLTNLGGLRETVRPGIAVASKPLLRAGIVLLGLQLALPDVLGLGAGTLAVVVGSVAVTFTATRWWIGRWFGLSPARALLLATGVSICGASAIAAMNTVAGAEEDDAASALAAVTLFGSLAIVLFPFLGAGLDPAAYGAWAGASVHEVGQVAAIGAAAGTVAAGPAVLVKLSRVLLLAPLVALVSLGRRRAAAGGAGPAGAGGPAAPVVPLFVAGFLAAMAVRSLGVLPAEVVSGANTAATLLLTAALFGLGTGVDLRRLVRGGLPTLGAGLVSTALLMTLTYAGLVLVR